ncbi:Lipid II flippase MurJ [anaerobic digester metagenome]
MSSKIAKGSFVILLGSFIFRIGGYIYRSLMAILLGPAGYGILGLTLPAQNVLILLAAGGLPPAIAKYVSHYSARDDEFMVRQVIKTSTKIMVVLSIVASIMIFFLAKPIAIGFLHKPEAVLPLQLISLITPFSVIVGALRGVFQGMYEMTNILITRATEQIFTIAGAVVLVLLGWYVAGAVVGTAIGFIVSTLVGVYIFKRITLKRISKLRKHGSLKPHQNTSITWKEEISIAKRLLIFSIPVVIAGFAELALYDIGTYVIGHFMASEYVGYYNAASPIARLPLVISMSIATAALPAASEAFSLNDKHLLRTYILQSYRYVTLLVLPLSVGTIVFAAPIIGLLFPNPAFLNGTGALQILSAGMLCFTVYVVSASICQGLGKPNLPMTALVLGTIIDLVLSFIMVPVYGINGAALATTIAAVFIMVTVLGKTLQMTDAQLPKGDFTKIIIASIIMGIIFIPFPKTRLFLFLGIILAPFIYVSALTLFGGLKKEDVHVMYKFGEKMGPLKGVVRKFAGLFERFAT